MLAHCQLSVNIVLFNFVSHQRPLDTTYSVLVGSWTTAKICIIDNEDALIIHVAEDEADDGYDLSIVKA